MGGRQTGEAGSFPRTKREVFGVSKIYLFESRVKYLKFRATYMSFGAICLNFGAIYFNFSAQIENSVFSLVCVGG